MGRFGGILVLGLAFMVGTSAGGSGGSVAAVQSADPGVLRARELLREWRTALRQAEHADDWVRADSLARAATGAAHELGRSIGCGRPCYRQTLPRP